MAMNSFSSISQEKTPFKTPFAHRFDQGLVTPKTPELNVKYQVIHTCDASDPVKTKLIYDEPDSSNFSKIDCQKRDSESIPLQAVTNVSSGDSNTFNLRPDGVIHKSKENYSKGIISAAEAISSCEPKKPMPVFNHLSHNMRSKQCASNVKMEPSTLDTGPHSFPFLKDIRKPLKLGHNLPKPNQEMPAPLSIPLQKKCPAGKNEQSWNNLRRIMQNRKALSESSDEDAPQTTPKGKKEEPFAFHPPPQLVVKTHSSEKTPQVKTDVAKDNVSNFVKPTRTPLATVSDPEIVVYKNRHLSSIPQKVQKAEEHNAEKPKAKLAALPIENGRTCSADTKNKSGTGHSTPDVLNKKDSDTNMDRIIVNNKPYIIINLLGRGGSSKVYHVLEGKTKVQRAVKVVNLSEHDQVSQMAYRKEVEILLKLQDCKRVITMYDFEYKEPEKELYIVMEKGDHDLVQILKDLASSKEQFSTRIKTYWYEMLKAVEEVHEKGIIHSDLKPANFIMAGGNFKLIDFGIASTLVSDMTSVVKDTQVGTVNYMSPESLFASSSNSQPAIIKLRPKSDVWSLGCILYNMTYGQTPFYSIKNIMVKMQAICNSSFQIPFPPCNDKFLLDVLKKCLERDLSKRPSIQELLSHPYLTLPSGNVESLIESLKLACSPNSLVKVVQALQPESQDKNEDH